ncbi:hypothetical protein PHLCEN_2v2463 [Hermanssonia centrifuga]|uniref:Uncharacterized protein n=1 Tax=Hermanssonia centrifuga TaxID=98765 RepID=A0A2R6RLW6_9APHY|nr:hypothetical protein PHLCEN_2v2463 [Hermanssonia centrifuga]
MTHSDIHGIRPKRRWTPQGECTRLELHSLFPTAHLTLAVRRDRHPDPLPRFYLKKITGIVAPSKAEIEPSQMRYKLPTQPESLSMSTDENTTSECKLQTTVGGPRGLRED